MRQKLLKPGCGSELRTTLASRNREGDEDSMVTTASVMPSDLAHMTEACGEGRQTWLIKKQDAREVKNLYKITQVSSNNEMLA